MKSRIEKDSWILTRPIAHRGFHGESAPENSAEAFKRAIVNNYPIETDLQITKDGNIVCFHDDNAERMTGEKRLLSEMTVEEIKNLRLDGTEEQILTFGEFLNLVEGRVPLMIEIKTQKRYKELAYKAIKMLEGYNGEFAVQSFDPRIMSEVRKLAPDIIRGQLITKTKHENVSYLTYKILGNGLLNFLSKPDFINMELKYIPVPKRIRGRADVICWTVRSKEDLEKAEKYGYNCIFENMRI
ncbi:MAG: glycerophosphodiester phosphodiesterase [Clostridia bacterium]|nr:glycerophosphodiester phosphodiesterase [Clostridia bacterium]